MKTNGAAVDNFGQLMISGLKGTSLSPEETEFIKSEKLGGVLLCAHNYESPAQLAELVNSIQKHRDEYPLFISVDHEGGRVSSFKTHFTQFPSMLEVASLDSPKLIFELHQVVAKELSACGVNMSYSPCCDILARGDEAYGADAETVEKFISAAIRGLQTCGLLSCAKHFPGLGANIKASVEELRKAEIIPFARASKSRAEFMMMGHLQIDALDEKLPTSLSARAYEFLRQETKFSKVVVTDVLEQKTITDKYSIEEAAVLAMVAGTDMLMFRSVETAKKALAAIRDGVKKKTIKRDDMAEKLGRVEKCKKENFETYQPIYIPKVADSFNTQEAKKLLELIKKSAKPKA